MSIASSTLVLGWPVEMVKKGAATYWLLREAIGVEATKLFVIDGLDGWQTVAVQFVSPLHMQVQSRGSAAADVVEKGLVMLQLDVPRAPMYTAATQAFLDLPKTVLF